MSGMPWSKWFWRDWLSDLGLRSVSPAARGVWIDMLCVAAQSDPFGHVLMNGKSITDEGIARLCGIALDEATKLRNELDTAGIFSRNRAGTIYCRRMVRDAARHEKAVESGKKGGNPTFSKNRDNRRSDNHQDKGDDNHRTKADTKPAPNATPNHTVNDRENPQKLEPDARVRDSTRAPSESSAAPARAGLSEEDQKWASLRWGIVDLYEARNCATPIDTHRVEMWRASTYDPNLILTIIRETLARKKGGDFHPPLSYFDNPIKEGHEKVWTAQRTGNGAAVTVARDWDRFVRMFVETQGQVWLGKPAPQPGFAGCPAPPEVIAKYRPQLGAFMPDLFPPLVS